MIFEDIITKVSVTDISITKEKSDRIKKFVHDVLKEKRSEAHHLYDNGQEEKRWYTGFSGEAAIETYIKHDFIDLSIGKSEDYHVSDLNTLGLDIGVKTVEYGKFPIIFKNSSKPEIIVLKISDLDFKVCGLATSDILNKYQSDDLILSPNLKARGTKTGFYGFEYLKPFKSIDDLNKLTNGEVDYDFEVSGIKYKIGVDKLIRV